MKMKWKKALSLSLCTLLFAGCAVTQKTEEVVEETVLADIDESDQNTDFFALLSDAETENGTLTMAIDIYVYAGSLAEDFGADSISFDEDLADAVIDSVEISAEDRQSAVVTVTMPEPENTSSVLLLNSTMTLKENSLVDMEGNALDEQYSITPNLTWIESDRGIGTANYGIKVSEDQKYVYYKIDPNADEYDTLNAVNQLLIYMCRGVQTQTEFVNGNMYYFGIKPETCIIDYSGCENFSLDAFSILSTFKRNSVFSSQTMYLVNFDTAAFKNSLSSSLAYVMQDKLQTLTGSGNTVKFVSCYEGNALNLSDDVLSVLKNGTEIDVLAEFKNAS